MQAFFSLPKRKNYALKQVHDACFKGDLDLVKEMERNGANLEEENKKGNRALHEAAYGRAPAMIKLLVDLGVEINAANKKKATALHIAVNNEDVNSVRILLESTGINVNVQDTDGDTPLHIATTYDSPEIKEIIAMMVNFRTVNFNITNKLGNNVFHEAACHDNHFAMQRILSKDPSILNYQDASGFTALHHATFHNAYNAVKTLLNQDGCDTELKTCKQRTALFLAVSHGHCKLVEVLLEAKADINAADESGDTPLHMSLKKRSDLRVHSISPSEAPAIAAIAKELWSNPKPGVDISLALACFLASKGADTGRKNKEGMTPLGIAGSDAAVELLWTWRDKYQSPEEPKTSPQYSSELKELLRQLKESYGKESPEQFRNTVLEFVNATSDS